ncbi:flagellar biosynthesis protein FlhA [Emcibacter sp.]|uniref:flagellar biosynthesis protein FlhA n=1 Tax=Emcibacter sp. TaxID=1979954 RepID=UPI002AA93F04|nr:flagellar biosynthesis protein FlhA [Emcibacter sp.]
MSETSTETTQTGLMGQLSRRSDIVMALVVMAILVVLFLPMPPWLLDLCLTISITFSVMILMTGLFIERPLDFNAFPTVLLIATMLRLALNVASTRLILSEGHTGPSAAGHVIEAFGSFVMGGNFVIGIIVFAVLLIVNFMVITKGSGRIAEVAARFSLDAMPGKQMAIDADLSSGLINEDQARLRRRELEDESTFFGSMDGAAKYVRGDAVAGLLITFINIIAGMIIGVAQKGMSFGDAANTYTLLTVGDGLVSQIPALIVSTAAGLLVTKSGLAGKTDKALFSQFSTYPRAIGVTSFLLFSLSLLPGIPFLPFASIATILGLTAWSLIKAQEEKTEVEKLLIEEKKEAEKIQPMEEPITTALAIDPVRLELGYGLLPLINDESGIRLTDQIKALRRQLAAEMGFVMPSVRILDNMQLPANNYVLRLKEAEVGRGDIRPNMLMVMDPRGETVALPGEETREPAFGLPAVWVEKSMKEEASFRGYTVVDAATVITTHITEIIKDNMSELMSYAEVQKLLDDLPKEHQKLVADLVPTLISQSGVQRILQNLLNERVSIRDLPTILEGIAEASGYTQNVVMITEHVRTRLARQISHDNADGDNVIPLINLSPQWEQAFMDSLIGGGEEKQLAMAPSKLQEFIGLVRMTFEDQAHAGELPVLLTSPMTRPYVRSIVERFRPATVVMSQNEVHPKVKIRTLGQI